MSLLMASIFGFGIPPTANALRGYATPATPCSTFPSIPSDIVENPPGRAKPHDGNTPANDRFCIPNVTTSPSCRRTHLVISDRKSGASVWSSSTVTMMPSDGSMTNNVPRSLVSGP